MAGRTAEGIVSGTGRVTVGCGAASGLEQRVPVHGGLQVSVRVGCDQGRSGEVIARGVSPLNGLTVRDGFDDFAQDVVSEGGRLTGAGQLGGVATCREVGAVVGVSCLVGEPVTWVKGFKVPYTS